MNTYIFNTFEIIHQLDTIKTYSRFSGGTPIMNHDATYSSTMKFFIAHKFLKE